MAEDKKNVPILCIDIERFTQQKPAVAREIMTRLQEMANVCGKFFSPHSDPWKKWTRTGTGDGYYFVFDELSPRVALKYT